MTRDEIAEWRRQARDWILAKFTRGETFSGNDAWQRGLPRPQNRRLLGSVLLGLESEGRLSRVASTTSEGGHGQRINVWRVVA